MFSQWEVKIQIRKSENYKNSTNKKHEKILQCRCNYFKIFVMCIKGGVFVTIGEGSFFNFLNNITYSDIKVFLQKNRTLLMLFLCFSYKKFDNIISKNF